MTILTLKWDCFGYKQVRRAFEKAGISLCEMNFPRKELDARNSEELATMVVNAIQKNNADMVFSFNYFPVVAIAAAACKIKYISWTYDSPYVLLYSKTISFPTNYAFVFDKSEYLKLRSLGIDTVYYLPMAADTDYYDTVTKEQKYNSDISMIGSMYTEARHNLFRHFDGLDEYTNGYIEGIMDAQKRIYGMSILERGLTSEIIKNIQKVCPMYPSGDGFETAGWLLANYFIARKLTAIERQELISGVAEKYKVTLYTPEKTDFLKNVDNRGTVEYYNDFPKAVKGTKINLNITLRSIVSGIPLRAFDIMGCGGFLLTNYQADFEDYFVAGEDYVYFDSKEDLLEKVEYYLYHDEERNAIAKSGYEKVKKHHNFDVRIREIMQIVG